MVNVEANCRIHLHVLGSRKGPNFNTVYPGIQTSDFAAAARNAFVKENKSWVEMEQEACI
jgi:hypothetical protein